MNDEQGRIETSESSNRDPFIEETVDAPQLPTTSLTNSLLTEPAKETNDHKAKMAKKAKTDRQKELERLTTTTEYIFTSSELVSIVCQRINSLLSGHKTVLLTACRTLDDIHSGRLTYEQFRLIIKDYLPEMSAEDSYILARLFDIESFIDYEVMLNETIGNGVSQFIKPLAVPSSLSLLLERNDSKESSQIFDQTLQSNQFKYVTLRLRFITFASYDGYRGHLFLTVPDHLSIYGLSKMIIDQTDFATRFVDIFSDAKYVSTNNSLDPMLSLEHYGYKGAYVNGITNQTFPSYTLYYDYPVRDKHMDCPILRCDHHMK